MKTSIQKLTRGRNRSGTENAPPWRRRTLAPVMIGALSGDADAFGMHAIPSRSTANARTEIRRNFIVYQPPPEMPGKMFGVRRGALACFLFADQEEQGKAFGFALFVEAAGMCCPSAFSMIAGIRIANENAPKVSRQSKTCRAFSLAIRIGNQKSYRQSRLRSPRHPPSKESRSG